MFKKKENKAILLEMKSIITGDFISPDSNVVIEGVIEGKIVADRVLIKPTGIVNSVVAKEVEINGTVNGNVEAKYVAIIEGSDIKGDIYASELHLVDPNKTWKVTEFKVKEDNL